MIFDDTCSKATQQGVKHRPPEATADARGQEVQAEVAVSVTFSTTRVGRLFLMNLLDLQLAQRSCQSCCRIGVHWPKKPAEPLLQQRRQDFWRTRRSVSQTRREREREMYIYIYKMHILFILLAMASNLLAMASSLLDGLQPSSDIYIYTVKGY